MQRTPPHAASHARRVGARVMPDVRLLLLGGENEVVRVKLYLTSVALVLLIPVVSFACTCPDGAPFI